jgi:hypothetical protein
VLLYFTLTQNKLVCCALVQKFVVVRDCIRNTSFSFKLTNGPNKQECLFLAGLLSLNLLFVGKALSLPKSGAPGRCFARVGSGRIGWTGLKLAETNSPSYWAHS